MNGFLAVYKREVALYFRSFIAYIIVFAVLGIIGVLFTSGIVSELQRAAQAAQFGQSANVQLTPILSQIFGVLTFLMFLVAPLITMRLLAEESREGTLEVLMTLPMNDAAMVIGKYLAAWTLYTFMLALTLVHTGMLARLGSLNAGQLISLYIGTWLYGGATLAVALVWSAITEDQLVAGFLGAATILTLMLTDGIALLVSGQESFGISRVAEFVRQLGFNPHFNNLATGIIRAEDIFYFMLIIIVALFITTLLVGTRRWRAS